VSWTLALILAGYGAAVGAYGTLIGAGGGFLIVPALLLSGLATAEQAAGTSLVAVFANSASGSLSYARQRRIDVRTALYLSASAVPGSLGGAYLTKLLAGRAFDAAFGILMLLIAGWLFVKPQPAPRTSDATHARGRGWIDRRFTDAHGVEHAYSFFLPGAMVASAVIGVLSSTLGIGGGVILVPVLISLLRFPPHVATATSQLVLAVSALIGASSHYLLGHVLLGPAVMLAMGAVVGAQIGAKLSAKLKGKLVVRLLSLALVIVGGRLVLRAL